jgi:DNA-binding transcriptional LysR family regulator
VIARTDASGDDFREVLEGNPYVRFNRQARVAGMIERALARLGLKVRSEMEIDTLEGVVSMVEAGLGVSIVPARSGAAFPEGIRTFPLGDPPVTRRLGLLAPVKSVRQRFVDYLGEALRESPGCRRFR